MKLLSDVDGDEVSLVNRAANRRRFLLLKGAAGMDNDLSDILEVPWEREGALLDEIRKDGITDENVEKAVIAAVRLLKGVEDEFSPELVEKLGRELYPHKNPALNTSPGVNSPGGLDGESASEEDDPPDGSASGADTSASVSGSGLEGSASAPKVAADAEPDEDDAKGKKGFFGRRSKAQKEEIPPNPEDVAKEDVSEINDERGTVETHAVPVQKEDGSWDYTDVPDAHAAFFRTIITKADETAAELVKTKEQLAKADDSLLSRNMLEKAAKFNHVAPSDDLAPILKEASQKLDPETFEKLESLFEAAEERVSKGDLFKEMGRTGLGKAEPNSDAYTKILAKADELVEKNSDLSPEAAFDKAMRANPDLYNEYLSEHGMGT